jgi:hypothetical protein
MNALPEGMAVVFIDRALAIAKTPSFDRKLLTEALQFRIANQMMGPDDFYLNVTVWKLEHKNGTVEYLKALNDSEESQVKKLVKKRLREGLTADPEASRKDLTAAVKDHLKNFYVYSGVHSEPKVAEGVSHRTDVRQGLVRITQVYTERAPCASCQEVMNNQLPAVRPAPFFYFLPWSRSLRRITLQPYGGDIQLLMLNRYGA